ncbi:MerR family transcriptional regulator [Paraburkholderia sp. J63]|uniref:MerR family transcriptional regulator n=1 Tax=Paraburkholderia sp. J63 TaxID=2805434 RepID=UPI002ABD9700|nr:MerR family transcriptional regulator [Paraburkholderia sp. J63]
MKIGELAERTGLAASRIRFYEGIGLLKAERQPNGYRTYSSQAVLVLNLITTAQQAGFSLDEIRMLLPPDLTQWKHGSLVEILRGKVQDIEALQKRLARSKAHLVALLADIEAKPEDMDCTANAKRVLSRLRLGEVKAPALEAADVKTLRKTKRRAPIKRG